MRSMLDLTGIHLSLVKVRMPPKGKVFMNGQTRSLKMLLFLLKPITSMTALANASATMRDSPFPEFLL